MRFAGAIPDNTFSPADLQEYLVTHMSDLDRALEDLQECKKTKIIERGAANKSDDGGSAEDEDEEEEDEDLAGEGDEQAEESDDVHADESGKATDCSENSSKKVSQTVAEKKGFVQRLSSW